MNNVSIIAGVRREIRVLGFAGLAMMGALLGCSGDAETFPTAKVSGTVTFEGKPVEGGELVFAPIASDKDKPPGKSGVASISYVGTYTLSTYVVGDGAVVGKHKVQFNPATAMGAPLVDPSGGHMEAAANPYTGLVPKEAEVTVQKGTNTIDIELIKAASPVTR